jgi:RNA polymerase sigma-70 factor, ECF subfamily
MEPSDTGLLALLARRDATAFEQVFKQYYKPLHAYAYAMVNEEAVAGDTVQTVFCRLWERADGLPSGTSIAAHLYRSVHHEALNHLKNRKVRNRHRMPAAHRAKATVGGTARKTALKELESRLAQALNDLPEQCRTVFQLSRFEELRYREIANRLNISVKTVESQMGKALKLLRLKLVDFLPLLLLVALLEK